jgi:hypothetical protein
MDVNGKPHFSIILPLLQGLMLLWWRKTSEDSGMRPWVHHTSQKNKSMPLQGLRKRMLRKQILLLNNMIIMGLSHDSFIHSNDMCRMWWFLAVLRSFFHSSLLCLSHDAKHKIPKPFFTVYYTEECYMKIFHQDCAMAQETGCSSLNMEAWVWSQASPCGICGGQSDTVLPYPLSTAVFPSVSFHQWMFHVNNSFTYTDLP